MNDYIFSKEDIEGLNSSLLELNRTLIELRESITTVFSGFDVEELIVGTATVAASLGTILTSLGALNVLGVETTSLLPELGKIFIKFGETLGGVLGAIAVPLGIVLSLVALLAGGFVYLMETSDEFRERIETVMNEISEMFANVYNENLKPIFDFIGGLISDLWENHIKWLLTKCGEFVGTLIEVLAPIVAWLFDLITSVLGPVVSWIFDALGDIVAFVSDTIGSIVQVIDGLFMIVKAIVTGDLKSIGDGFVKSLKGIANLLISICALIGNAAMKLVGGVANLGIAIYNLIAALVNPVLSFINNVFGTSINPMKKASSWNPPKIEIPKLAVGGLVEPGQFFLAREAGPELVGPHGGHEQQYDCGVCETREVTGVLGFMEKRNSILVNFVEKKFIKIEKNSGQTPQKFLKDMRGEKSWN